MNKYQLVGALAASYVLYKAGEALLDFLSSCQMNKTPSGPSPQDRPQTESVVTVKEESVAEPAVSSDDSPLQLSPCTLTLVYPKEYLAALEAITIFTDYVRFPAQLTKEFTWFHFGARATAPVVKTEGYESDSVWLQLHFKHHMDAMQAMTSDDVEGLLHTLAAGLGDIDLVQFSAPGFNQFAIDLEALGFQKN